jgi:hypothetical protein
VPKVEQRVDCAVEYEVPPQILVLYYEDVADLPMRNVEKQMMSKLLLYWSPSSEQQQWQQQVVSLAPPLRCQHSPS